MIKILFLSILPFFSFAQKAPKGTTTIIIHHITQVQAIDVFEAAGYLIAGSGNGFISTVPQKSKNGIEIVLQIEIRDSTGYLQGRYQGEPITPELWKASESYAGHYKGGSFEIMEEIAKAFHQSITYVKN